MVAILVLAVVVLVVAEFAARAYVSAQIKKELSEHADDSCSCALMSFGAHPGVPAVFTRKLNHVKVDIPNSLDVTYPDGTTSAPDVSGYPPSTITIDDLDMNSHKAGTLTLDTTLSTDYIEAAAQGGVTRKNSSDTESGTASGSTYHQANYSTAAQSIADRAIKVTAVNPNPSMGTFSLELSGGLADLEIKPTIDDGDLTMKVTNAKLLGMSLPQSVADVLTSQIEDAANVSNKELKATHVEVTSRGMRVTEEGHDVDLKALSDSANQILGTQNDSSTSDSAAGRASASQ